ncbi:response regulator [Roseimaritima sediminicola]|uniref:response regulator n=1 Tax=Roseimaritima sediminicola TaxID=2662066 RepID=UPI0012983E0F|nr:response regulator [Roseimaritima sediminicola]
MSTETIAKHILYVDDEPQALKYFARLFGDRFEIATAESVDAALEYLREHGDRVSVVVTDQRMPEKSGVQLMEQIRYEFPNIARILLTAYSELELAIQSVNEGGAFRYLKKPLDENEMIGTLLRAQEYHGVLDERDRLLREKISVLHRLIVMDRIRGLATAATALGCRVRNSWQALVAYMQQSPVKQRIAMQMDEIAALNMTAIARREAEMMVRTVELLLRDTVAPASGRNSDLALPAWLGQFVQGRQAAAADEDVTIRLVDPPSETQIASDEGLLTQLLEILLRRLCDLQEQPTEIQIGAQPLADGVQLDLKGCFADLDSGQVASLFAAAIPLQKWPIGLDMDLLSAFMLAHHLGGSLQIIPAAPQGPGFSLKLPATAPTADPEPAAIDPQWFDTVYESLEQWEQEIMEG